MRKLHAEHKYASDGVAFYLIDKHVDGRVSVALPLEMQTIDEGEVIPHTFILCADEAQAFIDELWQNGFRPSNMNGVEIGAQKQHLEDMRKIAFMFLNKEKME